MDHWPWMKFKAEKTPDVVHGRAYSPATISAGGFSHPNKLGRVLFAWINRRTEAEFPINQRISPTPQQLAINSGDFSTFKDFKVELSYFAQDRIFKNMSTATFRCCHPVLLNIKGSPTISGITPCLITGLGQKMVLSHPHHRHDMAWPHPGFKVLWCYPILPSFITIMYFLHGFLSPHGITQQNPVRVVNDWSTTIYKRFQIAMDWHENQEGTWTWF